ncbi:MAG: ABC transporter permease [Acidobacteriota bacterium]|nr:ABC transporter permease [Acidobacteriota bacterium]
MILQDLRYAGRVLRKSPVFTTVAVLSLALGIGANTAIFSVLDAVLLKSLPVRQPRELRIFTWVRKGDTRFLKSHSGYSMDDDRGRSVDGSFSYPQYRAFRNTLPQFSGVVAYAQNQFTLTAAGSSDLAFGHYVSGNYFTGLGAQALRGRTILPDDDTPGRPRVAVLSYEYWVRRFGSDASAIGRVVEVNRLPVTVVGVMPRAFQGLQPGRAIDVFVPFALAYDTAPPYYSMTAPDYWWVQVFGRLKPGVAEAAAEGAVQQVFARHVEAFAGAGVQAPAIVLEPGGRGVATLRGSLSKAIYILTAVAGIVLLIACANLANLLLARYAARSREVAIRVSIGASRGRLIRQMLAESFLLAGMGAMTGLALAQPLFRAMLDLFSGTSTLGLDARLDLRTLGFAFGTAIATGLLFGTLPAWRTARVSPGPALKESASIAGGRAGHMLIGRGLVSFQIALSVLLIMGTGLFLRTLRNLGAVDLGFQASNLITFRTDPAKSGYEAAQVREVYRKLEARLSAIPGVEAVGISQLPLIGGVVTNGGVRFPGSDTAHPTWFINCSDSFLKTMRIPVVLGRDLNAADFDRPFRSAVVNETFVRKYMAGENPVGRIYYPPQWDSKAPRAEPFTIVGVAKDAHYRGIRDEVPPTAYAPFPTGPPGDTGMVFAIRTGLPAGSMAKEIRAAVGDVDPHLPVAEMRTEAEQIEKSIGSERLFAALVTAFGTIALVLAAIGLYGIMAFSVSRRTAEIGIRLALGARRGSVQWLVMRQSLAMAALGLAAGVPFALQLTELAKKLLYGVKPNDPLSIVGAIVVIVLVAALASWIPARRASRLDPMKSLRDG